MIPSQMLKGTLEGCILQIIAGRETYGYEIAQQLRRFGFSQVAEGTVYPLLLRLEKNGLVETAYRQSSAGPKRKYFHLTPAGQAKLAQFLQNWKELEAAVNAVTGGYAHESDQAAEPGE